jgi:hypothetical protein
MVIFAIHVYTVLLLKKTLTLPHFHRSSLPGPICRQMREIVICGQSPTASIFYLCLLAG